MLIGEGLSNREVAERLTLSVRTVESHIYRAMTKTGTASRDELAALLLRHRRLVCRAAVARDCSRALLSVRQRGRATIWPGSRSDVAANPAMAKTEN